MATTRDGTAVAVGETSPEIGAEFTRLAIPLRPELMAHCYRMLGSVHDAEDAVQETLLRAWRSYGSFEQRSSLRTWLYRIATRVCLNALESRQRRPLPSDLGGPSTQPVAAGRQQLDIPWLEPIPTGMVWDVAADPAEVVAARSSVRLAFVAALQHLPPRHRAVVILCDVLKWRSAEAAEALGSTATAVDGIRQRARARLRRAGLVEDEVAEPEPAEQRRLLERYQHAMEQRDVAALVSLCTDDVVWEMPPDPVWYRGPTDVGTLVATACPAGPGDLRLIPVQANGQPGFGVYLRQGGSDTFRPVALQVLTVGAGGVGCVVTFGDPRLFLLFDLPSEVNCLV
ncbi:sigma-70 family RNA polymerase sigma factor [Phytoactinopolyspora limicola]|uniref:sigma-70 family RNA polymerase sigma factor n=1 Tax=Phytoactinopolyspora limicola TaxID=2715536 RepID=UPI001407DF92|nr:sigma-70 family RNA polymerase sigma factor [Phytoactinopolyspora limicola]